MEDHKPPPDTQAHLKEFMSFLNVLKDESDRGAALISVAMIDDILEKTILAFLLNTPETSRLLKGFNAPLGSFSARCLAAYSLGLLSEHEYRECERLRKIRNEFAHNVHQKFEDQKIKDICANLEYAVRDGNIDVKGQFATAATSLILHLTNRTHFVSLKRLAFIPWPI